MMKARFASNCPRCHRAIATGASISRWNGRFAHTACERAPERYLDSVPPISAYAHWNEEAAAVWYAENRYDMENPREPEYDFD